MCSMNTTVRSVHSPILSPSLHPLVVFCNVANTDAIFISSTIVYSCNKMKRRWTLQYFCTFLHMYSDNYLAIQYFHHFSLHTVYCFTYYCITVVCNLQQHSSVNWSPVSLHGHHLTPIYIPYRAEYVKINACVCIAY